jgi:hypothetical protein
LAQYRNSKTKLMTKRGYFALIEFLRKQGNASDVLTGKIIV